MIDYFYFRNHLCITFELMGYATPAIDCLEMNLSIIVYMHMHKHTVYTDLYILHSHVHHTCTTHTYTPKAHTHVGAHNIPYCMG